MTVNSLTPPDYSPETLADAARSGLNAWHLKQVEIRDLSESEMAQKYGIREPGYEIPYNRHYARARLRKSRKFRDGREQKYVQAAGSKPELYTPEIGGVDWETLKTDTSQTLLVCEGEKKAIVATLAGLFALGIGGVWCWKADGKALPAWDTFNMKGRKVLIVFDSDILTKPAVQMAEAALAAELTERGAHVERVRLPIAHKGIDDFLVAHGFPERMLDAQNAFRQLPVEPIDLVSTAAHYTDAGNAALFATMHGHLVRFVSDWKKWIIFDPATGLWKSDQHGTVLRLARDVIAARYRELRKISDPNKKKSLESGIRKLESATRLRAMVELAQSELGMTILAEDLDADRWLLGLGNGYVCDLKDGQIRFASPDDYLTKSVGAQYDAAAACPRWLQFMEEIFGGDRGLIDYVQKAVGYSLTGAMDEHAFFILHGQGANGKSTFLNTVSEMFGGYAMQAQPQTFMEQKYGSGIRNDVARLFPARLITTSEVAQNQRLDESFVKQWTGEDRVTARLLYQEFFEAKPQGKIWLATNHKPTIQGQDPGMWRRLRMLPFTITFPPEQQDHQLTATLRAELPGILNWALAGCQRWQREGLNPPDIVLAAVETYRADMDDFGLWVNENCEIDPDWVTFRNDLYQNYCEWTGVGGLRNRLTRAEFTRMLNDRGFSTHKTTKRSENKKGAFIKGIRLRADEGEERRF